MRLGIDFGTTRTVIAAVREGRYPVASFQTPDGFVEFLPGLASIEREGLRFGTEADTSPVLGMSTPGTFLKSAEFFRTDTPKDARSARCCAVTGCAAYTCTPRRWPLASALSARAFTPVCLAAAAFAASRNSDGTFADAPGLAAEL